MTSHLKKKFKPSKNKFFYTGGCIFAAVIALIGIHLLLASHASPPGGPTTPPVEICSDTSLLNGPSSAPSGAVTIPAGNNSSAASSGSYDTAGTTYYFASGIHTLTNQIIPGNNSMYIGAPGAIIDGDNAETALFEQHASGVTIEYLTIENYDVNENEGVVNHDSGANWTIEYNTVEGSGGGQNGTGGSAVMLGNGNTMENNCLTNNAQLGFNAYSDSGNTNITVSDNEISYNGNPTQNAGCGCDGGGKLFFTTNSSFTNNYIHNNGGVGLWGDTNNAGISMTGNYISNNYSHGIMYEISYNALIQNNTLVDNSWGDGPTSADFPNGAIYISNSGGDSRVDSGKYSTLLISNNTFTDNWGGVVEWEDSNRYCGSSDGGSNSCTLGNTADAYLEDNGVACGAASGCTAVTTDSCSNPQSGSALFWDCRWRTQNVEVTDNTFSLNPANIPGCEAGSTSNSNGSQCGYSGTFAQYGGAPYAGTVIENAVAYQQNNVFSDNIYYGPWSFEAPEQNSADTLTFGQWQSSPYGQDTGSTYSNSVSQPSPSTPPSIPNNLTATANSQTSVILSWSASTDSSGPGLAGYNVYRNSSSTALNASPLTSTSYTDTGLTAGTNYTYYVKAVDSAGLSSSPSNTAAVTTPASTPPATGTSTSTDKTFEDGTDNMSAWYDDTIAQTSAEAHSGNYSLAMTGTGGNWGTEENWPGSEQVTANTTYNFSSWLLAKTTTETISETVIWINSSGASLSSQTIGTLTDSAKAWVNLSGSQTAPAGAVSADLYFTGTVASAGEVHYLDDVTTTAATTPPPAPDTTPPSVPSGLTATPGIVANSVNLSWAASTDNTGGSGLAGYYVLRSTSPASGYSTLGQVSGTTYSDTTAVAATTYYYEVEAYDKAGNISAPSSSASITTPTPVVPLAAPSGVSATAVSPSQINLSWTETSSSVKAFEIYQVGKTSPIATIGTLSYGVTGLSTNTNYSFYIVASVGTTVSPKSATVSATTLAISTDTIIGTVTNSKTKLALSGVHVFTSSQATATGAESTYTNPSGQYVLSNIIPVRHYYTYKLRSYLTQTDLLTFSPAGTYTKNIALVP